MNILIKTLLLIAPMSAMAIDPPADITVSSQFDSVTGMWTNPAGSIGTNVYLNGDYYETVGSGIDMLTIDSVSAGAEICISLASFGPDGSGGIEFSPVVPDGSGDQETPICVIAGEAAPTEICSPLVDSLPPPSNISAFASGASVAVDWDPVPGATGYNIYRNGEYLTTVRDQTDWINDPESPAQEHIEGDNYSVVSFNDAGTETIYSSRSDDVDAISEVL